MTENCSHPAEENPQEEHELRHHYDKMTQFYSACVTAWYSTSFELDKSILTLSAAGIGLLIGLVSSKGVSSIESLLMYLLALLFFTVSLLVVLLILKLNRNHISDIIQEKANESKNLANFDTIAVGSFALGVLFSVLLGIVFCVNSYEERQNEMTNKTQRFPVGDSINGMGNLNVSNRNERSVSGAGALKPQQPPQTPPSAPNNTSTGNNGKK